MTALIEHLETTLCIDTKHVFAAGGSNAGMFAWELGQNPKTAPIFRAIAPTIGLPHRGGLRSPGRRDGPPVLLITGLAADTVPPGSWDDAAYTTRSNDRDRFYYTGPRASRSAGRAPMGHDYDFAWSWKLVMDFFDRLP